MAEDKVTFIHHVFFWLTEGTDQQKKQLIEGLKKLSRVTTIQKYYIGRPAGTFRDVIDSSFAVSWCLFFSSRADQDSYQVDPIHLQFIDECRHLWKRVLVYDSVDV